MFLFFQLCSLRFHLTQQAIFLFRTLEPQLILRAAAVASQCSCMQQLLRRSSSRSTIVMLHIVARKKNEFLSFPSLWQLVAASALASNVLFLSLFCARTHAIFLFVPPHTHTLKIEFLLRFKSVAEQKTQRKQSLNLFFCRVIICLRMMAKKIIVGSKPCQLWTVYPFFF